METRIIPAQPTATTRRGAVPWPNDAWRTELRAAITDLPELLRLLDLSADETSAACDGGFPLRVPRPFVARMKPGDPADPLLLQVLPSRSEALTAPAFVHDPLREADAQAAPGVLRKYHGRALLLATGACAVNCRYCFGATIPIHRQRHPSRPCATIRVCAR